MKTLICALDASKGYGDMVITGPDASTLVTRRLNDVREDHLILMTMIREYHARFPDAAILCGAENTGGLERHWLQTLRVLAREIPAMEVVAINPLSVSRMLSSNIHRAVTDAHSAAGIAMYLRKIDAPVVSTTPVALEGVRMLLALVNAQIKNVQEFRNQFQSFLPIAFPELVRFCRNGIPDSVLRIVVKYPSPAKLARAHLDVLAAIPYLKRDDARALIAAAKESITLIDRSPEAQLMAEDMGVTMQLLAKKILDAEREAKRIEKLFIARLRPHPAFRVLVSIRGIGEASAARLIALIGDVARFPNASKLVAYAGLDPMVRESGDKHAARHISRRGSAHLRNVLFNNARVAIAYPGPVKDYYDRMREKGKPFMVALVAAMQKLLRIVYACWLKDEMFDPTRHLAQQEAQQNEDQSSEIQEVEPQGVEPPEAKPVVRLKKSEILAPVSGREAKRRILKQQREEETLLQGSIVPCS